MIIGVPRERKTLEKRVAIIPDGAVELVRNGHEVLIETGAGLGSFFTDNDYKEAGCNIVPSLKDVWTKSDLIVKVKEPHPEEYQYFRKGLAIFDYLHLASMPELTEEMLKGGLIGIAYELVRLSNGRLPLLEPMSEVAGKLSVLNGAYYLLSQNDGRGVLLGGTIGVYPGHVVIIGAGVAGRCAAEVAAGMGANVTVLDIDYTKLEKLEAMFGHRVRTRHSTQASITREIEKADLVIGATLVPGAHTPRLITREMIRTMNKGSVFVDISIDQGGCAETSRPTSLEDPVYVEEGIIHYGVCNMPAQTPRTSTIALTAATLPYLIQIANQGVEQALRTSSELRNSVNTYNGYLTNKAVSEAVGIKYTPIGNQLGE